MSYQDEPEEKERPPFYMLHVRGKAIAAVFHDTFDSAAAEAERLALKENTTVAVLQGVALCVPPEPAAVSWEFADNVVIEEESDAGKEEAESLVKDFQDARFKEILDLLFPTR